MSVARASSPPLRHPQAHTGWRSRGYLPHFDSPDTVQHVVFRLADALPPAVMRTVERAAPAERIDATDFALDAGHGERRLADGRIAASVETALLHFDGQRYRLLAWCVMPTHVHVLVAQEQGHRLSTVVHAWKSFTANAANRLLGREGSFWAREYFDRYMRNEAQLETVRAYIEANPVKAGLCKNPEDWRFSSAWRTASAVVARASSPPDNQ